MKEKEFYCPLEAALSLIGGKYKPLILWHLREGALHYMQLQRRLPKATPKMLSQQLRGLEGCGKLVEEETWLAKEAIAGFPENGFLLALADSLAERRK